ncbi:LLM class flavin-dependent oxidoreductase [Mycobacteroides abscessus]|uniref:LLM class flavin-dependent oxidoreductase n=1 Tax=Mycobacteroides abscessus TaxID=36809 RepID=UPI000926290C|nr:LLM class flavin-dependent oxidoreductase [Mycobacteroides abscessus]SHT77954.1 long-chain-fatty-acid--CoA ligase [Mycobacteroides abscessus subsp. bolletii]SHX07592.1 long-chain-fatty-acid--CoA ligase [Mycobacteroides abscessus subsp. bolletii]SHX24067.1 long-chain-fatty-acid--CoA ligase [Mycobacteroides abscessus subsp. bolletii]SHX24240.1 long-chain-fatty-acid--CoA ligase [Mycobacteroides abscessus subsp. bolletii]SKS07868.1 long-chain-fatty-acid--CoA ligase [Mycobacteroides abscessus su
MRFQLLDIVFHLPNPATRALAPAAERLNRVIETAVLAENLGFDSFAVGERHAGDVLSSAPTVLLGAVAAATDRILLSTGVTVLSLLDPVRAAEDFATIDQLSRGRLEIVIGKGNEDRQYPLMGLDIAKQYEYLQENYELLRRLLREEHVDWVGAHRHPLADATTLPRPYDGPFRIWHGSATSTFAVELAAKWGDPIVTANALQPKENYRVLIDRYRELYARHGHDPAQLYVGAGSGGLYLADTTEQAIAQYRPIYEARLAQMAKLKAHPQAVGKFPSFESIEDAADRGPVLAGSPERVAEKILDWHEAFGHEFQSISLSPEADFEEQKDTLRRFAEEVVPLVRAEVKSTLWGPLDTRRAKGFTAA